MRLAGTEKATQHGAKLIASKNREYWDNWQGWHTPKIYAAEDCIKGEPTEFNFSGIYPAPGAVPVAIRNGNKWETVEG